MQCFISKVWGGAYHRHSPPQRPGTADCAGHCYPSPAAGAVMPALGTRMRSRRMKMKVPDGPAPSRSAGKRWRGGCIQPGQRRWPRPRPPEQGPQLPEGPQTTRSAHVTQGAEQKCQRCRTRLPRRRAAIPGLPPPRWTRAGRTHPAPGWRWRRTGGIANAEKPRVPPDAEAGQLITTQCPPPPKNPISVQRTAERREP